MCNYNMEELALFFDQMDLICESNLTKYFDKIDVEKDIDGDDLEKEFYKERIREVIYGS